MAQLSQKEFEQSMRLLCDAIGLQRLTDKFFKYHGLVTRRGFKSAEALATHVYTLSGGLRRQVPSNLAFQAIWAEYLADKLGEEGAEKLEKVADSVNACLDENEQIIAGKEAELDKSLLAYQTALSAAIGLELARADMLMKAVPAVAERLRNPPPISGTAQAPPAEPASGAPAEADPAAAE
ncbi:MAG TPA: hypothetical protein VEB21_15650 [Terriglobales bacterium]|nr:hypothetical protein [Terriglobales bacterium]